MASYPLQRRRFLQALGASAASLPFTRLIQSSVADAQTTLPPMRLLLLYTSYGGPWEYLRPTGVMGKTEAPLTPEMFAFDNSVLAPLKKYASKMLLLEGMAVTPALIPNDNTRPLESRTLYLGHESTCPSYFTGSAVRSINGTYLPNSASLEYELGQQLGDSTAVRSLQLGIGCSSGNHHLDSMAFDRAGNRLPGFSDPGAAFRQLFGNTTGTSGVDQARVLQGQKSVLNAVQSSAKRMRSRLAGPEKLKLDDHLSALADIESRLAAPGYSPISCGSPMAPPAGTKPGTGSTLPADTALHFDILAQAFACDRTRFVTAGWGSNDNYYPSLFGDIADWHSVAHSSGDTTASGTTARLQMAKLANWYSERLAGFMDRLDSIKEANGSVLDNTLIFWGTDFGQDVHGGLNMPYVLLGGAQGKLRMGRYLNYMVPSTVGGWGPTQNYRSFQPINRLLVSILNAFGVQTNTFGSTEFTGPLNNLT
jgi:hypothetical protein